MSLKSEVRDLLANDATVQAHLTGGVYTVVEIKKTEEECEDAFDDGTGEILPCANIRVTTENPFGPHDETQEVFFTIYYYQYRASGNEAITAAAARVRQLLHRRRVPGTTQIFHSTSNPDLEDPALEASLHIDRYRVVRSAPLT